MSLRRALIPQTALICAAYSGWACGTAGPQVGRPVPVQPTVAVMPPQTVPIRQTPEALEGHARTLLTDLERMLEADSVVSWIPLAASARPIDRHGGPVSLRFVILGALRDGGADSLVYAWRLVDVVTAEILERGQVRYLPGHAVAPLELITSHVRTYTLRARALGI